MPPYVMKRLLLFLRPFLFSKARIFFSAPLPFLNPPFRLLKFRGTPLTLCLLVVFTLGSCSKKVKPKEGQLDLLCSLYRKASKGLDLGETFLLSSLYFSSKGMLERADQGPGESKRWSWIQSGSFTPLLVDKENPKAEEFKKSVYEKAFGAPFHKGLPMNFEHRRKLSDTVVFRKKFERIEISSKKSYARYYLYRSDTLLPYGLYPEVEKKLGARVERIEAYDPKEDVLVTLQLFYRTKVEKELKTQRKKLKL